MLDRFGGFVARLIAIVPSRVEYDDDDDDDGHWDWVASTGIDCVRRAEVGYGVRCEGKLW